MRPYLIPLILAAGAAGTRVLDRTLAVRFPVDFAQPMPVATSWGVAGVVAWAVLGLTLMAAGVVWYRLLDDWPPLRTTLIVSALSLVAALCWSPVFSSDVYAYAAYGQMERLGLDPYLHHPHLHDAIVAAAQWQWSGSLPVCVYGEAFAAFARALVSLTFHAGMPVMLLAFRIAACCGLLCCALLARGRAAFFIACNPLAVYVCAEGHNDVLMIAVALAGVALSRRHVLLGVALMTAAAAIKAPALLAGWACAFFAAVHRRHARSAIAGAAIGSVVAIAASWRLMRDALTHIGQHGSYHPYASVQALSPYAAVAIAVLVAMRLRSFPTLYDRAVVSGTIVWLAIPNPYAWYALWLLVPAAFAADRRVSNTVIALAAVSFLRYLPDAGGAPSSVAALALSVASLCAYLPLAGRPKPSMVYS